MQTIPLNCEQLLHIGGTYGVKSGLEYEITSPRGDLGEIYSTKKPPEGGFFVETPRLENFYRISRHLRVLRLSCIAILRGSPRSLQQ